MISRQVVELIQIGISVMHVERASYLCKGRAAHADDEYAFPLCYHGQESVSFGGAGYTLKCLIM